MAFADWFRKQYPRYADDLTLGSFGEDIGARRMDVLKLMGLTPGYPDVVLYIPRFKNLKTPPPPGITPPFYCGLFIEMKTKTGIVSPRQKKIHARLIRNHYRVEVARDWLVAADIVTDYLSSCFFDLNHP